MFIIKINESRTESCPIKQYIIILCYAMPWSLPSPSQSSVAVTQKLYIFVEYLITVDIGMHRHTRATSGRVHFPLINNAHEQKPSSPSPSTLYTLNDHFR